MSIIVRSVEKGDEERWRDLWEQYNVFYKRTIPDNVTTTTFNRFLDEKTRMYAAVAVDAELKMIVGFVTWYPHANTSTVEEVVYLNDLFVDPTIRNKGVGASLIQHVYEHARSELDAAKVYWLTMETNHQAQLLYSKVAQRSGFVHYQKKLKDQ
jgi:D-amino-acid N-acetyltransferase